MKMLFLILFSSIAFGANYFPAIIVTNGDMSTAEIDSIGMDMRQNLNGAIQAVYTGAPVGTIKLQFSTDIQVPGCENQNTCCPSSSTWNDYTGSSQAVAAAGRFAWNLLDAGYACLRLVYVKTSGTGSLNATFIGKGPK